MRATSLRAWIALLALACGPQMGIAADPPELPGFCEASAAHWRGCADGSGLCLLGGDNEDDGKLFEYRADRQGGLTTSENWRQPIGDTKVGDIEAVTTLDGDLVVVGSHSRKKKCDRDVERLRLVRLKASSSAAGLRTFSATASIVEPDPEKWLDKLTNCTTKLIVFSGRDDTEDARNLRDEVCKAIVDAESPAGEGKQTSDEAQARCFHGRDWIA